MHSTLRAGNTVETVFNCPTQAQSNILHNQILNLTARLQRRLTFGSETINPFTHSFFTQLFLRDLKKIGTLHDYRNHNDDVSEDH